jgi:hypothetical protein
MMISIMVTPTLVFRRDSIAPIERSAHPLVESRRQPRRPESHRARLRPEPPRPRHRPKSHRPPRSKAAISGREPSPRRRERATRKAAAGRRKRVAPKSAGSGYRMPTRPAATRNHMLAHRRQCHHRQRGNERRDLRHTLHGLNSTPDPDRRHTISRPVKPASSPAASS